MSTLPDSKLALEHHAEHEAAVGNIRDRAITRAYGDAWVREQRSVILKVNSVGVSESYNYLINPNHPDFLPNVRLEHLGPFGFDKRVEKLVQEAKK